jgi:hypothetical protein
MLTCPSVPGSTSAGCILGPFLLPILSFEPPLLSFDAGSLFLDPELFDFLGAPLLAVTVCARFDGFLSGPITGSMIAGRRVVEDSGRTWVLGVLLHSSVMFVWPCHHHGLTKI